MKETSTKQRILTFLDENKGENISGEKLAENLNITRGAVWKAVKSLQNEGYHIEAITNKGYCLTEENDILSVKSISKHLTEDASNYSIEIHKTVDSTNTRLKHLASNGEQEGKVIISETQTAGKGRMGRKFYSPPRTGLYMSILIKPEMTAQDSLLITTGTAVAVAKAIEEASGCEACIKWVNDIYVSGKKVCGILTEAAMDFESGYLDYAVIGIGVNLFAPDGGFPGDLNNIATAVFDNKLSGYRNMLAAGILNNLSKFLNEPDSRKYMDEYRKRSFLIGKRVYILPRINDALKETAKVIDVDDNAGLVVELENGEIQVLTSGEVSVRQVQTGGLV